MTLCKDLLGQSSSLMSTFNNVESQRGGLFTQSVGQDHCHYHQYPIWSTNCELVMVIIGISFLWKLLVR